MLTILLQYLHTHPGFVGAALICAAEIRAALRDCDMTLKVACLWMKIDVGQFERQLNGEGHLSIKRMERLPLKFWSALAFRLSLKYKLPSHVRRGVPLALLHLAQPRMARMELSERRQKRTA
jgi:hypothetical protein